MKDNVDIFFRASSEASLMMYKKTGKIPVALSVLIKNKQDYELLPIGEGVPEIDAKLAQTALDYALRPVVKYISEHEGSFPILFFLSCTAEGGLKDLDTDEIEQAHILITSARTQDKKGKTNAYKIKGKEFIKLTFPENDVWQEIPDEKDLPAVFTQRLLDMVWKSFIVSKNMYSLNLNLA